MVWAEELVKAQTLLQGTSRGEAIEAFCRSFVPVDVTEDDIQSFSGQLSTDEEFFDSFCREILANFSSDDIFAVK